MIAEVEAARTTTFNALPAPEGVHDVRLTLSRLLSAWELTWLEMDAMLIVSELVTNAISHAHSSVITIHVSATDKILQITVDNVAKGAVTMKAPDANDESGRGLLIVNALAVSWGIINCGPRVCVFANLRI